MPRKDLFVIFGPAGVGKDALAAYIQPLLPRWNVQSYSAFVRREYEQEHGLPHNYLEVRSHKDALRPELAKHAHAKLTRDKLHYMRQALAVPRPLVLHSPKATVELQHLWDVGAIMIRLEASEDIRRKRMGAQAYQKAQLDRFDQQARDFPHFHKSVSNNGDRKELRGTASLLATLFQHLSQ